MLELYIEQNEYLPILSDVAGIRLVIHNQTYMPLPEKEGIVLATGLASGIAITRVSSSYDTYIHTLLVYAVDKCRFHSIA